MQRRQFINLIGGAAAWPFAARAQRPTMPLIGFLHSGSPEVTPSLLAGFRKGLIETGYIEGRNVAIEYSWAYNDLDRLPELAADLIRRRVTVIATPNGEGAAFAVKAATTTIPIVSQFTRDPVQAGLVASFNRPGGNITGVTSVTEELGAKRLGLLHELLPRATRVAVLVHPNNRGVNAIIQNVQAAALTLGLEVEVLTASTNREIDMAFASLFGGCARS
jgi:putative tryptophan/tyrosine transport system substrate-binding protein